MSVLNIVLSSRILINFSAAMYFRKVTECEVLVDVWQNYYTVSVTQVDLNRWLDSRYVYTQSVISIITTAYLIRRFRLSRLQSVYIIIIINSVRKKRPHIKQDDAYRKRRYYQSGVFNLEYFYTKRFFTSGHTQREISINRNELSSSILFYFFNGIRILTECLIERSSSNATTAALDFIIFNTLSHIRRLRLDRWS